MSFPALERFPDTKWAGQLAEEDNPWPLMMGVMAMARLDVKQHLALALKTLDRIDWQKLTTHQKLNWLRAAGLVFIRGGEPTEAERAAILAKIDSSYPADDQFLNSELAGILCDLQAPGAVARTLELMDTAPAPEPEPWAELVARNSRYGGKIDGMLKNHPPSAQIHYP